MNAFFVPQLGSMIYTMNGMVTQLNLRADQAGRLSGAVGAFQRRRLLRTCMFDVRVVLAGRVRRLGRGARRAGDRCWTRTAYAKLARQSVGRRARRPTALVDPALFEADRDASRSRRARARRSDARSRESASAELTMLGKLSWGAIPLDQPIPLIAVGAWSRWSILGGARLDRRSGASCPISGASGSPASTTSASASCTRCSRW